MVIWHQDQKMNVQHVKVDKDNKMDYYQIKVKNNNKVTNVLNFINDTKKFFQLEELKIETVKDDTIISKFTPAFANVIELHEDVSSITALL